MDNKGYIKLYRKLKDNPIGYNLELLGLLSYILMDVNFKENTFYRGSKKIVVKPGEKIFSQRGYAERFGVSISKIHRYLKILSKEKILKHEGNSIFTTIKLNNWDTYNGNETQIENKGNTNEKQIETNKNVKNVKNVKNTISKDIETKVSNSFGNEEINTVLNFLCKSVGVDQFKETQKWQRIYVKHIMSYTEKIGKEEFIFRLKGVLQEEFKAKNCNSIKYLYNEIKAYIHSPLIQKDHKITII